MHVVSLKLDDKIDLKIELLHVMIAKSPQKQKPFGPVVIPYSMFAYTIESEYYIYTNKWHGLIKEKEGVFLEQGEDVKAIYPQKQQVLAIQLVFRILNQENLDVFPRVVHLTDPRNILELSLTRCLKAYENQHFTLAKAEFLTIMLELLKMKIQKGIEKYSIHVRNAIEYINNNFLSKPMREEIATSCQINPMYLSSIFRKETGETMKAYMNQKLILYSKELLSNGDNTISETADILSMDVFSFSRLFKKYSGISPSQYSKIYGI